MKTAERIQMPIRNVLSVPHQRVILENTRFALLVNKLSIAVLIVRSMIGRRNINLSAKSYKRRLRNELRSDG